MLSVVRGEANKPSGVSARWQTPPRAESPVARGFFSGIHIQHLACGGIGNAFALHLQPRTARRAVPTGTTEPNIAAPGGLPGGIASLIHVQQPTARPVFVGPLPADRPAAARRQPPAQNCTGGNFFLYHPADPPILRCGNSSSPLNNESGAAGDAAQAWGLFGAGVIGDPQSCRRQGAVVFFGTACAVNRCPNCNRNGPVVSVITDIRGRPRERA